MGSPPAALPPAVFCLVLPLAETCRPGEASCVSSAVSHADVQQQSLPDQAVEGRQTVRLEKWPQPLVEGRGSAEVWQSAPFRRQRRGVLRETHTCKYQGLVSDSNGSHCPEVKPPFVPAEKQTAGRNALDCSPHRTLCLLSELHPRRGRGNLRAGPTTCLLVLLRLCTVSGHPRPHCSLPGLRLRRSSFICRLHLGGLPKWRAAEVGLHHLPALVLPLQLLPMQGQREPPRDLQLPGGAAGRGSGGQLPPGRHRRERLLILSLPREHLSPRGHQEVQARPRLHRLHHLPGHPDGLQVAPGPAEWLQVCVLLPSVPDTALPQEPYQEGLQGGLQLQGVLPQAQNPLGQGAEGPAGRQALLGQWPGLPVGACWTAAAALLVDDAR